jgi:uncharacterized damage-inducible protein DinB
MYIPAKQEFVMPDVSETDPTASLFYAGWEGYNQSLINALECIDDIQLVTAPGDGLSTPGELLAHIAMGRIDWFSRIGVDAAVKLMEQAGRRMDSGSVEYRSLTCSRTELKHWLDISWQMVNACLESWDTADMNATTIQPYGGKQYVVPRQWIAFRILAHDIHHGGQLSMILFQMGVVPPDLGYNGGHITPLRTLD